MHDREKVIKGLEYCIKDIECTGCPYEQKCFDADDDRQFGEDMMRDALALLREQEKATVISIYRNGFGSRVGACPNCQSILYYEYNQSFCGKCGQAVKWDD